MCCINKNQSIYMNIRYLLLFVLSAVSFSAVAQDKIYKTGGDVIEAKVSSVGTDKITYKRYDNQNGPDYMLAKSDILKIVYQNGTVDVFTAPGARPMGHHTTKDDYKKKGKQKKYGNNILSVIPGAYSVSLDGSINDPGVGISYERLLDENGHIGLSLPVIVNFSSNKDFNNTNSINYTGVGYTGTERFTSFCFMPGVKFYPARNTESVRYSLGASFFVISGGEPYQVYDYGSGVTAGTYRYAMYGLMFSNSVNVSLKKHLYMALDINAGIPFSDNRYKDQTAADDLFLPMLQFVLRIGGRF